MYKYGFWACDLELWPTTLTYNPELPKVKVDLLTEDQGQRANGSGVRALKDGQTNKWTDWRYQVHYYLPASLSYAVDNKKSVPPIKTSNGIARKH